jgi:hypothetical protein
MPLTRLVRFLLLLLFVLLQCVAPLAHAHVNNEHGDYNGPGVHIGLPDTQWLDSHDHESASAHLSAGEHHSAVVCMPPEFRYSAVTIVQPVAAAGQSMPVRGGHSAVLYVAMHCQNLPLFPCQHPCSQAPPVQDRLS